MKKIVLTFTLLLFFVQCKGQNSSVVENKFSLKAKMIQDIDVIAGCGYSQLATVIDFEIIQFSDKTYQSKNIGVVIRCPEFYGKNFFEKGKVYEMKVEVQNDIRNDNFDYSIQNMKSLEKYKNENIYWAIISSIKKQE